MPNVVASTMNAREQLADLCNERGLVHAVEIGTDRGLYARDFLARWHGEFLFCIDPYEPYDQMPHDRTPDLVMACTVLAPHADRCKLIRARSKDATGAIQVAFVNPDFVYIDGAHDRASVETDIATWWPLLKKGGVLAGHDYVKAAPGVVDAVNALADREGLTVHVIHDRRTAQSWYVEKPR